MNRNNKRGKSLLVLLVVAVSVCAGCGGKVDAGANDVENKLAATKAGVSNAQPTRRSSKPPFDPTK
jgi:hypothetical protein